MVLIGKLGEERKSGEKTIFGRPIRKLKRDSAGLQGLRYEVRRSKL